jgi:hypothetical protein
MLWQTGDYKIRATMDKDDNIEIETAKGVLPSEMLILAEMLRLQAIKRIEENLSKGACE